MAYPKKSEEDKNLHGTNRNDRLTPESIQAEPLETLPEAPKILEKTGRKQWKKYTKILKNQGILAETDLDLLGQYCMYLQIAEQAGEMLRESIIAVNTSTRTSYLQIFNEANSHILKLAKEFGFTPLSRKSIPAPKKKREGKLVKLMGRQL